MIGAIEFLRNLRDICELDRLRSCRECPLYPDCGDVLNLPAEATTEQISVLVDKVQKETIRRKRK